MSAQPDQPSCTAGAPSSLAPTGDQPSCTAGAPASLAPSVGADDSAKSDVAMEASSTKRERSQSSSSSSSSSSRSRSRSPPPGTTAAAATKAAAVPSAPRFVIDDYVEVFGLRSEGGKALNGRKGAIMQHIQATDRYEVSFGPDKTMAVRPENLKKCERPTTPAPASVGAVPKPAEQKKGSLASLLGNLKPEEKQPEVYQSIWERSGTTAASGALTDDQMQMFSEMQAKEEAKEAEEKLVRDKVTAEFAAAGVFDQDMIEQAFQEQLEQHRLNKLLRPQDFR